MPITSIKRYVIIGVKVVTLWFQAIIDEMRVCLLHCKNITKNDTVKELRRILAIAIVCYIALVSCSSDTPERQQTPEQADPRHELNILCIGNSYTWDAMLYVPYIMQSIVPDLHMTIGILYTGAENLDNHYNSHMLSDKPYTYFHMSTDGNPWIKHKQSNLRSTINAAQWNLVTIQQSSSKSTNATSYSYLQAAVDWIHENINVKATTSWLITPAYPVGSYRLNHPEKYDIANERITSDEMYNMISECVQTSVNGKVDLLIPIGTAIQNARHTTLSTVGRAGSLSYDGIHLQDGLPRLIAAYAVCESLLNYYKLNTHIDKNKFVPTDRFIAENIPEEILTGAVVGIDSTNVAIATQCVFNAINNPFKISEIE